MPASRCAASARRSVLWRGSSPGSPAAMLRRHHARDRLRPSRWTICGSPRSLTSTGESRLSRGPTLGEPRQPPVEPLRELRPRKHTAHQIRLHEGRRQKLRARRLVRDRRLAIGAKPFDDPGDAKRLEVAPPRVTRVIERENDAECRVRMHAMPHRISDLGQVARDNARRTTARAARDSPTACARADRRKLRARARASAATPSRTAARTTARRAARDTRIRPRCSRARDGAAAARRSRRAAAAQDEAGAHGPAASACGRTSASRSCRRTRDAARAAARHRRPRGARDRACSGIRGRRSRARCRRMRQRRSLVSVGRPDMSGSDGCSFWRRYSIAARPCPQRARRFARPLSRVFRAIRICHTLADVRRSDAAHLPYSRSRTMANRDRRRFRCMRKRWPRLQRSYGRGSTPGVWIRDLRPGPEARHQQSCLSQAARLPGRALQAGRRTRPFLPIQRRAQRLRSGRRGRPGARAHQPQSASGRHTAQYAPLPDRY